ncbi:MAG: hypothetical protein R3C99_10185 [Pirellulaceae bacterium]
MSQRCAPSGMSASVEVSPLLPGRVRPLLSDEHIAAYESAAR